MIEIPLKTAIPRSRRGFLKQGLGVGIGALTAGCGQHIITTGGRSPPTPTDPGLGPLPNLQPTPSNLRPATAIVTQNGVGTIGQDFLGLSFEKSSMAARSLSLLDPDLVNRFNDLGPHVLRIGGAAVDTHTWNPSGRGRVNREISPVDVDSLAAFLQATGWKVIYGINLAQNDPTTAANEAAYVAQKLRNSLYCFELGNEPDIYTNTYVAPDGSMNWTYELFKSKWDSFRTAILAQVGGATFAGPDAANNVDSYAARFARETGSAQLKILTQHHYRIKSTTEKTIDFLLVTPDPVLTAGTPGRGGELARLPRLKAAADAAGIPFRFSETNSATNGGVDGVSNVYASALWSIDLMFTMAKGGAEGVNFHSGSTAFYSPFDFQSSLLTSIRPEYYGILFFNMAGLGEVLEASVDSGGLNLSVYAIKTVSGFSVMFVNKENQSFKVALQVPVSVSSASVLHLTGPGLPSKTGIKIQNAEISVTFGLGAGDAPYSAPVSGQRIDVHVPALAAVLVKAS